MRRDYIIEYIVFFIVGVGLIWLNYTYVQPYGLFSNYCLTMNDKGYFIDEYDTISHYNCTIGMRQGPDECDWMQRKIMNDEKEKKCFNYDSYNDTCENDIDFEDYGMRCTWMSLGYISTVFSIMLWVFPVFIMVWLFIYAGNNK